MAIFGEVQETASIVPGRKCGVCSLCCKVLEISEIGKPVGKWCDHCAPGKGGCKIYDRRPAECQTFHCAWLTRPEFGTGWFPAKSKMVVCAELQGNRIAVHVDPGFPATWQQKPFYDEIKNWARNGIALGGQVTVNIAGRVIVILPDDDVDLGTLATDEIIAVAKLANGKYRAFKQSARDIPADQLGKWVNVPLSSL
jgi:hypothetical protein